MTDQEQRRFEVPGGAVSTGYPGHKRVPKTNFKELTCRDLAREIMRLEAARQSLDDEILRLRHLQANGVS